MEGEKRGDVKKRMQERMIETRSEKCEIKDKRADRRKMAKGNGNERKEMESGEKEKSNKERGKGEARLSRDPKWSSERSTHLQAKVEFGALNALDT